MATKEFNLEEVKSILSGYARTLKETDADLQRLIGKQEAVLARLKEKYKVSTPGEVEKLKQTLEGDLGTAKKKLVKVMEEIHERFEFE